MKGQKRPLQTFFKSLALTLAALTVFSIGALGGTIAAYIKAIPPGTLDEIVQDTINNTTIIFDEMGREVATLNRGQSGIRVSYNQIPKDLINAFIAIEDERFWYHNGIDIKRIIGAFIHNLQRRSLSEGASTITQQLVRNKLLMFEKSFKRKIQEQYLAIQLEKRLTKQQILEEYLNTINLGNGAYGVQAAAYTYFGKDVSKLSLAECALIAGITKNPSYYNPFKFPDHAKKRQQLVLKKMLELGYITEEEYYQAINQKLVYAKNSNRNLLPYKHPYFVDSVIDEAIRILQMQRGITQEEAEDLVYGGGLKIYTTLDSSIQSVMEEVFSDSNYMPTVRYYDKNGVPQPQAAAVLIDFRTGAVKGIMGGRGNMNAVRLFNRATMSVRQPGSAIKPIAVYALALERGYGPWSVILDAPFSIGGYAPKNWYANKTGYSSYKGYMTLRQALVWSANVPAVKLAYKLGVQNVYENLQKFGFTTLTEEDKNNLSIAIGGFTYGVKPIELTAAFAAVANGGVYIKPHFITKIEDRYGNTINEYSYERKRVMEEKNAQLLTDMLQSVVKTGITIGTSFNYPVAGKTGTTDDNKDRWFVGYTPDYVLGVWVGEDEPRPLDYLDGTNPAVKIFKGIMDKIVSERGIKHYFTKPYVGYKGYVYKSSSRTYKQNVNTSPSNSGTQILNVTAPSAGSINSNSKEDLNSKITQQEPSQAKVQNSSGQNGTQSILQQFKNGEAIKQSNTAPSQQAKLNSKASNEITEPQTIKNNSAAGTQTNDIQNSFPQSNEQTVSDDIYSH
ncbi:transglycosylase domain-containing protein [Caldicellulosiruptor sp. F32]|uniref:transglycosylase domain-containing protein n=1 Tax=Caldicellulosiruptor sp. F32 TaxID=1214564 RepID=UPI0003A92238|nr:PBP1A family penicillin-binding protein [Caldicellulosiruptor sp. F32]